MSNARSMIVEGCALTTEIPPLTVPQLVRRTARRYPDRTAIVDGLTDRRLSYAELDRLVGRFAAGLAALGFRPQEVLLLFTPNQPEWLIAALGAMSAGGVVSGANSHYGAAELEHQMREVEARFVLTTPALLATVQEAVGKLSGVTILLTGEAPGTVSFASLIASTAPEPLASADIDAADIGSADRDSPDIGSAEIDARAALPFSSGTSGLPKGVILTHRSLVANLYQCRQVREPPDDLVWLAYLPLFHIYGFTFSIYGLAFGGTLVTLPRFEPKTFLAAIERHRVTHLSAVPPVVQFLAMHPLVDSFDLSSLVHIGCGAAPLGSELEQRASERLKCPVEQGFGMTESSAVIATTYPGRARSGSCGQLLPGTEARIVDPITGTDVERGVAGELWFRGPQAFRGYLNNPAITARAITPEGWVCTGDVGYFDVDGYLYITDRLKELIKVKGFQVAPAELEALLLTHPAVLDAAVIGRSDARAGEVPVAFVVAREPIDAAALKEWVARRVIDYKHLHAVIFCESIPKSPAGKILRRLLRAQDAGRARA
jgi:acyl-CoA synthetase (AMP-forming)/AMP-acid ligase II